MLVGVIEGLISYVDTGCCGEEVLKELLSICGDLRLELVEGSWNDPWFRGCHGGRVWAFLVEPGGFTCSKYGGGGFRQAVPK